ncbi:MAG: hypothetical protein KAJ07_04580 [Planctomycetes bacterium]|nr:hypothetical protein [Planctomycetota bacterium]
MTKLLKHWDDRGTKGGYKPPTKTKKTLGHWSSNFDWAGRKKEYDARIEDEENAALDEANQRARERVLRVGAALDYKRIERLAKLLDRLESMLDEYLIMEDAKQLGGHLGERYDFERYNSSLISDIRGIYDDLAKETGGRVRMVETDVTTDGDKLEFIDIVAAIQTAREEVNQEKKDHDDDRRK